MNDQERQIISDIFQRLEQTSGQARDAEAERFIADKVRSQPYAPYAMAQSLYVQEEAMKSLNQQLEQLKAENAQLQQHGGAGSGGFLSSIFGGGQQPQPAPSGAAFGRSGAQPGYAPQPGYPPQQGYPQGGPWGGGASAGGYAQPQQGGYAQAQPQASGGGFLRGALTTAAGVAGGMVVGNALMNAFSGGHHALGGLSNADLASMGGGETIVENNYFGSQDQGGLASAGFDPGGLDRSGFGGDDNAALQDASFDDSSFDDGGADLGGDDDSSWT